MSNSPQRPRHVPTPRASRSQQSTPSAVERAEALRDVMDHAVRMHREISEIRPIRRSRAPRIAAVAIASALLAISAWSLIARPPFIWGSSFTPSAARAAAETRVGLYLLSQRIEAFRSEAGEYPMALGDIGEAVEGIRYTLLSDTLFELRSTLDTTIALRSGEPVDAFLGNSIAVIHAGTP